MQIAAGLQPVLSAPFIKADRSRRPQVPDPAETHQRNLIEKRPISREDLDIMRERHQLLFQMLLDLTEEIDVLRERLNMLCRLWREKN
jgi:hypothetical protein